MNNVLRHTIQTVRDAGKATMGLYGKKIKVAFKEHDAIVTEADNCSDDILHRGLARYGWPILSEESIGDNARFASEYVWIIDPLDGTKSFVEGVDDFSVMVGLVRFGKPMLGIVFQPAAEKLYYAVKDGGAFLETGGEKKKLAVSVVAKGNDIRMVASRNHFTDDVQAFVDILHISVMTRVGSNGIKIGLIAEGGFDLFFNPTNRLGEWDICAPQVILEESGGKVAGVKGETLVYNKKVPTNPYGLLASNGLVHNEAIRTLRQLSKT